MIISIHILSMYIISRLLKFDMWLCFLPLVCNDNDMLLKRFIYKKVTEFVSSILSYSVDLLVINLYIRYNQFQMCWDRCNKTL
jgi:hypothetical protein